MMSQSIFLFPLGVTSVKIPDVKFTFQRRVLIDGVSLINPFRMSANGWKLWVPIRNPLKKYFPFTIERGQ
jgi:hypothetical protein